MGVEMVRSPAIPLRLDPPGDTWATGPSHNPRPLSTRFIDDRNQGGHPGSTETPRCQASRRDVPEVRALVAFGADGPYGVPPPSLGRTCGAGGPGTATWPSVSLEGTPALPRREDSQPSDVGWAWRAHPYMRQTTKNHFLGFTNGRGRRFVILHTPPESVSSRESGTVVV